VKFIDDAVISVESGRGGSGCVSFRREKYIPRGGPDGGDGGKGGDVIVRSTSQLRTLYPFQFKRHFKAPHGRPGQGRNKTGKNGADLVVEVPTGTLVIDAESETLLKDLDRPDESLLVAQGGRGGKGNLHFKSATHRTPRLAQSGEPGQSRRLRLELKLLADVGIVGLPNAGKSTLISAISSATPKIGHYPFTTLTPNLGVVQSAEGLPVVVADIPGLIAGAHEGAGLGLEFLRHIERTRILIHLIDAAEIKPDHPLEGFETVNRELALYDRQLAEKPQLVVLNKLDLPEAQQAADAFQQALAYKDVIRISALTKRGVQDLVARMRELLSRYHGQAS
jgi:GTP-binding protein